MPQIKITTWNIEHMHDWFADTQSRVIPSFDGVARKVAAVIDEISPHVLCIQEGPARKSQMKNYLDDFVGGSWTILQGETGGSQKPYILWKQFPGLQLASPIDFSAPEWKYPFLEFNETDNTFFEKTASFARLPVEVLFTTANGSFSVMCLHLKSKFAIGSSAVRSTNKKKRTKAIGTSLEQRARILQEASQLRDYVQKYPFDAEVKGRMIIAGDLNDGPGRDFFEKRFFGTDIMRRIRGDVDHLEDLLTDVLDNVADSKRFTAIFNDRIDRELRKLLLDHLLVTPELLSGPLKVMLSSAKVEQDAYERENEGDWSRKTKPKRKLYPSDHRPATVEIRF
jgi:endonuclease/exonuclease/phosphatase family metal-dependent hydrolase